MTKISVIAGLGFGDEGKGTTVEHLTRISKQPVTVIRYSGGAQAAHNVILPDNTHHTFKQFGSGTFHGARTHLSRHMLVNPLSLQIEAGLLMSKGVVNPYHNLTIERTALVTNIYQIAANRVREINRGANPHGSCGMGIGETVADALECPEDALRVQDLPHKATVKEKLELSRQRKLASLPEGFESLLPRDEKYALLLSVLYGEGFEDYARAYYTFGLDNAPHFVGSDYLSELQSQDVHLIFEGAQGVLLDQDYGFFPHVTRSKTTFDNARNLLEDGVEYTTFGILRSYMTRHGAGPMPTEGMSQALPEDIHNKHGEFQGGWRVGPLDLVLLRYAVDVIGGVDRLVLTHLDRVPTQPQVCLSYQGLEELKHNPVVDLDRQMRLTESLTSSRPIVSELSSHFDLIYKTQLALEAPVQWCSFGPTYQDKLPPEIYLRGDTKIAP